MKKPSIVDYALLLGLAAVWGASFVFIKMGVDEMPAATQAALRMAIAVAGVAIATLIFRPKWPQGFKTWAMIALSGFFGITFPFYLIAWGQEVVAPGLTAIFMAIMPLITLVLAHLLTHDEKFSFNKLLGVICGICGVVVLFAPALDDLGSDGIRQGAILLAAGCYSVNAVLTKLLLYVDRVALASASLFFGFLPLIPFSIMVDGPYTLDYSFTAWGSLAVLGLVQTAGAAFVLMLIIARQGATFFSQINLLVPLFGVLWALLIFGEQPAINASIALVLILAGILVARGNLLREKSKS